VVGRGAGRPDPAGDLRASCPGDLRGGVRARTAVAIECTAREERVNGCVGNAAQGVACAVDVKTVGTMQAALRASRFILRRRVVLWHCARQLPAGTRHVR
jgi:hypothetical protein